MQSIKLEEYIPLKIIFNEDKEAVEYISYSKNKNYFLEFVVGIKSRLIKRMVLLLSLEYSESENELAIGNYEEKNLKLYGGNIECSDFKTTIYSNGVRILLSNKSSSNYIKMNKVYFGLSVADEITEICVYNMKSEELNHLKRELELQ